MIALPQNILSIQSWVAYGHVGNAAAIFPLQRMGFEVWAIHTVQFSNHTGYGDWTGQITPPDHLHALIVGLEQRGVLPSCDAVLSGYLGSPQTVGAVVDAVIRVRAVRPDTVYCCDPVMGDVDRGVFVRPEIPEAIQSQTLPLADILTPNHFELELLSRQKVVSLEGAIQAAQILRQKMHKGGPRIVLVTSLILVGSDAIQTLAVCDLGAFVVQTPIIPLEPPRNGTGDAIAALFLGHYLNSREVKFSLERAVSALFAILERTHHAGTREIQLIAAQEEFLEPKRVFVAREV